METYDEKHGLQEGAAHPAGSMAPISSTAATHGTGFPTDPNAQGGRPSRYLNLKRLPTLQEVLNRRTRPPLDLFCFYIFLQRESSEDALDFWLDVQQHENLCKAYFKDLKRSSRTVDDDWPEFASYARSNGSFLNPMLDLTGKGGGAGTAAQASRSTDLVHGSGSLRSPSSLAMRDAEFGALSGQQDVQAPNLLQPGDHSRSAHSSFGHRPNETGTGTGQRTSGGSFKNWGSRRGQGSVRAPTIFSRDRAIEKQALVESAERIYLRYLLPGAEREVYLPPGLRLTNFPVSEDGRVSPQIPDLFHAQKLYIFRALERDAFPRFLRSKAFGNLTPVSAFVRLLAGLLVLWGGFVLAFSFIFLNWSPKSHRLYVIIPFFVAFNLLLAAYYSLSPCLAALRLSETQPFHFIKVRESYVGKLLLLRALWIECLVIVLTIIFTLIFVLVPGHRL